MPEPMLHLPVCGWQKASIGSTVNYSGSPRITIVTGWSIRFLFRLYYPKEDISVVPLAIPLMAGPGAISLVILDANKIHSWGGEVVLALAIIAVVAIAWLVLLCRKDA